MGFGGQAAPEEGPSVRCFACDRRSPASEVEVHAVHRLEGASDPDDMAIVMAVTCPQCSVGATLVLAYGPTAEGIEADVLRALPDPPAPVNPT